MVPDHSSMTRAEFIISALGKVCIGFFLYKSLLFRPLQYHSLRDSFVLLFLLILAFFLVFFIIFRRWKTGWTSTACAAFPFGIYTMITYASTRTVMIRVCILTVCILSAAYTVLLASVKVKNSQRHLRRQIYKHRLFCCGYSSLCISTVAMCTLMVIICTGKVLGLSLMSSSINAVVKEEDYENTLQANMDTVLKLQPEIWEGQTTQERLNILQTICNIEVNYLGLPSPISVELDNLPGSTIGVYSDELKLIQIDLDYIENAPVEDSLACLLHEVHHSFEHRLADVFNTVNPEMQNLRLFRDAKHYANELEDYTDPREDYWKYISQRLEIDSDTYSEFGVKEYYSQINDWLNKNVEQKAGYQ